MDRGKVISVFRQREIQKGIKITATANNTYIDNVMQSI